MLERRSIRCAISSGLLRVLAHGEQVLHLRFMLCRRCVRLSAIWLVSAFYVSFVASLVPCDMSGFMEMFGPQGSVGFMCVLSLFVPDICF